MNRLSKPVGLVMKKAVTDGKAKTAVEWAEYYGGQSPGPGEYDVVRKPNWKPEAAGKFGRGKLPISDIDRRVKEGVPGPGQYDLLGYLARQKSGESCVKMAKGRMMKSDIDWKVCYAKGQPGPCHYAINDEVTSRVKGGRFSKGTVKSDIDWKVLAAREGSPGPGAYVTGSSTSLTKGSRISKSERWQYNQLQQQQQQQQQQQKQKQQRQRQQQGWQRPRDPHGRRGGARLGPTQEPRPRRVQRPGGGQGHGLQRRAEDGLREGFQERRGVAHLRARLRARPGALRPPEHAREGQRRALSHGIHSPGTREGTPRQVQLLLPAAAAAAGRLEVTTTDTAVKRMVRRTQTAGEVCGTERRTSGRGRRLEEKG